MTNADQDDIMSRVMKLLNLANDEGATPHERELAEERAEKLMAQHMIDRFEAEHRLKNGSTKARSPIANEWEILLTEAHVEGKSDRYDFDYQMIDMMKYVLKHCNVRVHDRFKYGKDYKSRIYQIVGFPEDIAYAERIWFNVFKTFVSNVNPVWSTSESIGHNAYNFASAGVSWKDQVLLAEKAQDTRLDWPWRYQNHDPSGDFYTNYEWQDGQVIEKGNDAWGRSIHKIKRACKQYSDAQNVPYPYARGSKLRVATRNSFARSYRATISSRLDEIRNLAQTGEDHVDVDKYALALVDTKARVDEEFYRLFPEYDPEVRQKKREEQEFARACAWAMLTPEEQKKVLRDEAREEAKWQRRQERARNNYRAIRIDNADTTDRAAWQRGQKAANSVNLRADEEVKTQVKKEIS